MKKLLLIIRKHWYVFAIVLLIVGVLIWRFRVSGKEVKQTTYTVKRQTLQDTLSFSGEIDADEKVTLRFQSSGKLIWVGAKEGDSVKKFQTIASLDQESLKKSLQKELNDYVKTRIDFEQEKDDTRPVVIGGQTYDKQLELRRIAEKAQYDLNSAVIDVELQDLSIRLATISTPIAGIVTKASSPYAGVNVTPTQAEFEIVNPDTVYFSALADQTEVVKLENGTIGEIVMDAYPDEKVNAEIKSIAFNPKEDETGTVYPVKMKFENISQAFKYRLGMTGDVLFILKETPNVLVVPQGFLKTEKGKKYVLKKVGNRQEKAFVKTGESNDILIEILDGLEKGDVIYD